MKDEKKYYVIGKVDAGTWAESETFFRISSKKPELFVLPVGGYALYESFYEKLVKPMSKKTAEEVVAWLENRNKPIYSDFKIVTEKQLLARFARRLHVFVRKTTSREVVNSWGKKDIVDVWERFYGSEADCAIANKGLRNRFFIEDTPDSETRERLKAMNSEKYIGVESHLTNDYYRVDRIERRFIER